VRPEDVRLGPDEADAEDGVAEAVKEGDVGLILEPPDVDVGVDRQPGSVDLREKSDHAVTLNMTELFHLVGI